MSRSGQRKVYPWSRDFKGVTGTEVEFTGFFCGIEGFTDDARHLFKYIRGWTIFAIDSDDYLGFLARLGSFDLFHIKLVLS